MDAVTRQKMLGFVEAFSQKAHDTGMAIRPITDLLQSMVKHASTSTEFVDEALKRLKSAEKDLPKSELYALRKVLTEIADANEANKERCLDAQTLVRKLLKAAADHGE